ncbi:putative microbial collagenase precursor [Kitasatospora setae KM-6054]|uniref:microbial collagenase n=2 Tax=Streptomycetaceae TaxID=2062 RepID=E4N9N1_KITSK|nr:putative microbial collagenase precursor [Kitasatospora setae KM-6054]
MAFASAGRTLSLLLSLCMALGFLGALAPGARAADPAGQKPAKSENSDQALKADRAAKAGKEAPLSSAASELRKDSASNVRSDASKRPPLAAKGEPGGLPGDVPTATTACNASDFTGRTGAALVAQIKASTVDCVNSLFLLKGNDAKAAFNESQMVTVANALRDVSANYAGDNSASAHQIVLYLRAGYYVQWYNADVVGTYGSNLKGAIEGGLDAFFNSAHAQDVTDANGETLGEAVTLIDSSLENARYLNVVKRLLNGYNSSYDASWYMVNAVNNTFTVFWRGHQNSDFLPAVKADPSVLSTLQSFANRNIGRLGTDKDFLVANSGRELGRFLQYADLKPTVSPMVKGLLDQSSITGNTASLWVGLAEMTDSYDKANCAYYGTCDLVNRVKAAVLTVNYTCSDSIDIIAQSLTADQLATACTSLKGQDAYFHNVAKDNGPVADDKNTTIDVVVFHSSSDYQKYAGIIFGISTNNGGMYLEGDPTAAGNQPRFIAYEAEWVRPDFQIWNLNHEYTHFLDGRFDMYGDFDAGLTTPTVWWVEGFAEYVNYGYRGADNTGAIDQAGQHTYPLSTLFDTTYQNADQTRIYSWGYLAVRYMLEQHRSDMDAVLAKYRTGDWAGARTILKTTIGTRYDADFNTWLTACNAGACGKGSGTTPPTTPGGDCTAASPQQIDLGCTRKDASAAAGDYSYFYVWVPAGTANLTVSSSGGTGNADLYYNAATWATTGANTAKSTNSGNTETLTIANPTEGWNYVSLYAAGDQPISGVSITATNGTATTPPGNTGGGECTAADTRQLDKGCVRSNVAATNGNYAYFFVWVPNGTASLKINASGGTGNADLYYNAATWATTGANTAKSTNSGNTETLTIANPTAGWNFVSLYAAGQDFAGTTVSASF